MIARLAAISLLFAVPASAQQLQRPWPDFLSKEAQDALAADAARPPEPAGFAERRARSEAIQQEIGQARLKRWGVTMTESEIGGVPVRIFDPAKRDAGGPVLLNFHGGAFLVDGGSITENAAVAAQTGYRVVAARYRLAPDYLFPLAVDDALAVYQGLLKERPASRIGVYGTSAGAILSAQLVARLRAEKLPQPAALGFFSGNADFARVGDSFLLYADPALNEGTKFYVGRYGIDHPLVSPLQGDLAGWPPTLCVTSSRDFLLSATSEFCGRLEDASVPADLIVFDGLPHAFWSYIDAPETDRAFAAMARFFRGHFDRRP